MRLRTALVVVWAMVAMACGGHTVLVRTESPQGVTSEETPSGPAVVKGSGPGKKGGGPQGTQTPGTQGGPNVAAPRGSRCATTSNPEEGFTESTIKIGTILPLSGPLRPLGEQVSRVMHRTTQEYLPTVDHYPGPLSHLNWGCPERPGIFGRTIELEVFSLQANTPEEALGGMRRLIDVENVFLVRDCYLQDSLMGPATQYQNSQGVPGIWCHAGSMPVPELAHWTFNPGIDPLTQAAIHTGYLINELGRERLAILADVNDVDTIVRVVRNVARHFGHPIPDDCIVTKRSQEASRSMRSEIARVRTCYGPGQSPDAVFAGDALQAVFGAIEAKRQGWRPADVNVQWSCTNPSCWVISLAEICGDACEGMLTDCATLPCVPWADPDVYPSAGNLENVRRQYLPNENRDAVTYGAMSIGAGITLWLTMTGPDLSRDKFRQTVEGLDDWTSGIGPLIDTSPSDHYGARAQWLIRYTGRAPWFDDVTGDFITIEDVGVPVSLTRI